MEEQKEVTPKTESINCDVVEEYKKLAIDFVNYLKSNKLSLIDNKIKYKGKRVGVFDITKDDECNLQILAQYDEYLDDLVSKESEEIKLIVNEQSGYTGCGRCITGKCACTGISFKKLNKSMYDFAKKLVTLRCDAILNERVPKCNYVKLEDRGKKLDALNARFVILHAGN